MSENVAVTVDAHEFVRRLTEVADQLDELAASEPTDVQRTGDVP